jgi:hypothetical protein
METAATPRQTVPFDPKTPSGKALRDFAVQGDFVKRWPAGRNGPAGLLYAGLDVMEQPLHALAAVVKLPVVVQPEAVEVLE